MYEVACEAFPDIPGAEDEIMESYEDWLAHHMQGSGDLPEATFLALAGDEVVGYSKFSLTAAQPTTANHDMTGVKRVWRGRGIAGALKRAQIAWAKQQGYERTTSTKHADRVIRIGGRKPWLTIEDDGYRITAMPASPGPRSFLGDDSGYIRAGVE